MLLEDFFSKLEEKTGISPLVFNEEGVITLGFIIESVQYSATLEKTEDDKSITLYAKIGGLPQEKREECMHAMLSANLFGYELKEASLGLDKDTDDIYLFRNFSLETLDFDYFFTGFEDFLQVEVAWMKLLKENTY
ncbi:MAG: type III secretion system chaperone [Chlamydiales bacterium]|nr:type III secretion system chaperone [Chlamydiales bacterium]